MNDLDRQAHWQSVYATKAEREVSWFQEDPAPSLDLIAEAGISTEARIIDVGGGASRLVDGLLKRGFTRVAILDLSAKALEAAKQRLGRRGDAVAWIVADVTTWNPSDTYDLWHDRAAFHFLTDPADRDAYIACLKKAVRPGGHVIIATFASDGPERCSGLPIVRYDPEALAATLGPTFELVGSRPHDHLTPGGNTPRPPRRTAGLEEIPPDAEAVAAARPGAAASARGDAGCREPVCRSELDDLVRGNLRAS